MSNVLLKFIYFEKATKFCKIFPLLMTVCTAVISKGKISQNFVAFSEYMNFTKEVCIETVTIEVGVIGFFKVKRRPLSKKIAALSFIHWYWRLVGTYINWCIFKLVYLVSWLRNVLHILFSWYNKWISNYISSLDIHIMQKMFIKYPSLSSSLL